MREGLDASTVAPGMTAPLASLTAPAMAPRSPWAIGAAGNSARSDAATRPALVNLRVLMLPPRVESRLVVKSKVRRAPNRRDGRARQVGILPRRGPSNK